MVSATLRSPSSLLSDSLGDLATSLHHSIVSVRDGRRGSGTGVVWSTDTVITNHHVVRGEQANLVFADGREATADVIGRDPHNDIVVLHAEGAPHPAPIGDSTTLRIGQIVLAVGHPMGIEHAVTVGIVSGLPTPSDPRAMIRSDLHLLPGNSGGPLVAADGTVVGINAMVAGPGTALSVPEYSIRAFLLRLNGQSPFLGLELTAVQIPRAWRDEFLDDQRHALLITGVEPRSVAESAGLYPGDLLLRVGDRVVQHPLRLREELASVDRGQPIRLHLVRGGEPLDVDIHFNASA
jgi:serine protease Do